MEVVELDGAFKLFDKRSLLVLGKILYNITGIYNTRWSISVGRYVSAREGELETTGERRWGRMQRSDKHLQRHLSSTFWIYSLLLVLPFQLASLVVVEWYISQRVKAISETKEEKECLLRRKAVIFIQQWTPHSILVLNLGHFYHLISILYS